MVERLITVKYGFAKGILNILLKSGVITVKQYDELDKRNQEKYS